MTARKLQAFGRDLPSLIKETVLFDFDNGRQSWPPIAPRDMSLFDPLRYADPRASADWWKFAEADAARAKVESQWVNDYYERQSKLRKDK